MSTHILHHEGNPATVVADLCVVTLLAMVTSALLASSVWSILAITASLYHAISLTFMGCTPAVLAIDTYASAHPQFRRRGEVAAFRRLESAQPADVTFRRGTDL